MLIISRSYNFKKICGMRIETTQTGGLDSEHGASTIKNWNFDR